MSSSGVCAHRHNAVSILDMSVVSHRLQSSSRVVPGGAAWCRDGLCCAGRLLGRGSPRQADCRPPDAHGDEARWCLEGLDPPRLSPCLSGSTVTMTMGLWWLDEGQRSSRVWAYAWGTVDHQWNRIRNRRRLLGEANGIFWSESRNAVRPYSTGWSAGGASPRV